MIPLSLGGSPIRGRCSLLHFLIVGVVRPGAEGGVLTEFILLLDELLLLLDEFLLEDLGFTDNVDPLVLLLVMLELGLGMVDVHGIL